MADIYTLAEQLGAKNLTNNAFSSNPMTQNYLTQRGRVRSAEEQLQATKTPLGALSSGIALYMQKKEENRALEELNKQMQAQEQARIARRESLINALPEANRVIAGALTDEKDLAKYASEILTPNEEDMLSLENKKLQNQKLQKDIASGADNLDRQYKYLQTKKLEKELAEIGKPDQGKAPAGYRFNEAGDLEAIAGGPATKQSAEAAGKIALIKQGLSDISSFETQLKDKDGSFNRTKIAGMRTYGRPAARDEYSKLFNALNARLRLESGAAVPESEVKRAFETFAPSPLDSDATIDSKIKRQKEFFQSAQDEIGQGRGANPIKPNTQSGNIFQSSTGVKFTIKR